MKAPIFYLLLMVLFTAGCMSVGVQSDYAPNADLAKYKTYAWMPPTDTVRTNLTLNASLMKSINDEMYERGYRLDTAQPDVALMLHTMIETKTEVVETPIYSTYHYYRPGVYSGFYNRFGYDPFYGGYYWPGYTTVQQVVGYDIETVQYKEGSVVIDMIDTGSKHLVWRGWTENALKAKLQDDTDDIIDKLFKKRFPVKEKEEDR